jgi:hypothetical protein
MIQIVDEKMYIQVQKFRTHQSTNEKPWVSAQTEWVEAKTLIDYIK